MDKRDYYLCLGCSTLHTREEMVKYRTDDGEAEGLECPDCGSIRYEACEPTEETLGQCMVCEHMEDCASFARRDEILARSRRAKEAILASLHDGKTFTYEFEHVEVERKVFRVEARNADEALGKAIAMYQVDPDYMAHDTTFSDLHWEDGKGGRIPSEKARKASDWVRDVYARNLDREGLEERLWKELRKMREARR